MLKLRKIAEAYGHKRVREITTFEQQIQLVNEQLLAARGALRASQQECQLLRKDLNKEVLIFCFLTLLLDKLDGGAQLIV